MDREFFDNAFDKAKNAFEVAYKKTGEVVNTEKIKFNITSLKSKKDKLFAKLGKEYYNDIKNGNTGNYVEIFDEIEEINEKIEELSNEIDYAKNKKFCPSCGKAIDESAVFCSFCGAKVIFDSSKSENNEEV